MCDCEDAGVVNENIQPTKLLANLLHHRGHGSEAAHVRFDQNRILQLRGHLLRITEVLTLRVPDIINRASAPS